MMKILTKVYPLVILCLILISCKKKEESCWECFSKPKQECQGMGKCKWEPKISIDKTWGNANTESYTVTDNGRCMCEQDNIAVVEKNEHNVSSLPFYAFANVSSIGTDKANNIWICHDNTTEYFAGGTWAVANLAPNDNVNHSSAPYPPVNCGSKSFASSYGNFLFAATAEYGMASLNAYDNTKTWTYYQTLNTAIPTQSLNDVYAESDNIIWLGTKEKGLVKCVLPNTWTSYNSTNTTMHTNNVTSLTADLSGNIWMGNEYGFAMYSNGTVKDYMVGLVHDIAVDGDNNVWVATDDGIKKWNTSAGTMEYFGTETSGLNTSTVLSLTADRNGKIWIGTNAGLYAAEGGKIVKYSPANAIQIGLVIKALSVDQNNRVWMATDNGVAVLTQ